MFRWLVARARDPDLAVAVHELLLTPGWIRAQPYVSVSESRCVRAVRDSEGGVQAVVCGLHARRRDRRPPRCSRCHARCCVLARLSMRLPPAYP
eukprot:3764278-Rhodomonas_salina.1